MKTWTIFFNQGMKKIFSIFFLFFLYNCEAKEQKSPRSPITNLLPYHFILASDLFEFELFEKAIEEYNKVLEIDPGYSPALSGLGYSYLKLNKHDQAIKNWKKLLPLLKEGNQKAGIYLNLGLASFEKKKKASSLFYTFQALQLSTQHKSLRIQNNAKNNLVTFKNFFKLTDAEVIDIVKHFEKN